jgi:hypothetical protein
MNEASFLPTSLDYQQPCENPDLALSRAPSQQQLSALQLVPLVLLELLQTRLGVRLSHIMTGRANAKAKDVSETSFPKLSLSIKNENM